MKKQGKVGRSDLEGGYFTFTSGGETYKIEGGGPDLLHVGVEAEVQGSIKKDAMGIGFGTPVLVVKTYKVRHKSA